MTSYVTPKKNTQYIFYISLVSQSNTKTMQSNPTLAAGDFKVSIDGGTLNNLGTLPVVTPSSSKMVKVTLSSDEMNGDNITLVASDASGAEWCDLVVNIQTSARQIDDLAYPATSGRSTAIDASGQVTVGAIANSVITAAAIATDAIDADSLKADAVTEIWSAATRTLTQTAAQVADAVSGSDVTIVRGVTFEATIEGLTIPATWSKVYFTIKRSLGAADSQSIVQIVKPASGSPTGLLYLNKAAAGTAGDGALTVTQASGTVDILLKDEATAALTTGNYVYDLKVLLSDGSSRVLTAAAVMVADTATEALS